MLAYIFVGFAFVAVVVVMIGWSVHDFESRDRQLATMIDRLNYEPFSSQICDDFFQLTRRPNTYWDASKRFLAYQAALDMVAIHVDDPLVREFAVDVGCWAALADERSIQAAINAAAIPSYIEPGFATSEPSYSTSPDEPAGLAT